MRDLTLEKIAHDYIEANRRWGNAYRANMEWFKRKRAKADVPIIMLESSLRVMLIREEEGYNFGVVCRKKVTTEFVNFMVDQLQAESSVFGDFKYHMCGTGTNAESNGDTQLQIAVTTTRIVGTQVEGASANIYRSVATITPGACTVTEHVIFNEQYSASQADGTLMDRSVFTGIVCGASDSIQFTYELTCTAEA